MTTDRGLQAERTALAWTRTALAVATSGVLLVVREHGMTHDPVRLGLTGGAVAAAAVFYGMGQRRRRDLMGRRDVGRACDLAPAGGAILLLIALVVIYVIVH